MSVANRLVESGHYASQQIKQIANQLEQEWKAFAAALDERSTLLDMSSIFHQKAEKVSAWDPQPTRREPDPIPPPSCVSNSLQLHVGFTLPALSPTERSTGLTHCLDGCTFQLFISSVCLLTHGAYETSEAV